VDISKVRLEVGPDEGDENDPVFLCDQNMGLVALVRFGKSAVRPRAEAVAIAQRMAAAWNQFAGYAQVPPPCDGK
jgi:hypothetical protein